MPPPRNAERDTAAVGTTNDRSAAGTRTAVEPCRRRQGPDDWEERTAGGEEGGEVGAGGEEGEHGCSRRG